MRANRKDINSENIVVLCILEKSIAIVVFKVKVAAKVVKSFQFGSPLFSFLSKDYRKRDLQKGNSPTVKPDGPPQ
jgi:hypothetical protein